MAPHVSLLQFADSLFPIGGHAHSLGLEYYFDAGRLKDSQAVQELLVSHLQGRAGPCDAGAVPTSVRLARHGDLNGCLALDRILDAQIHVSESREASRQMGYQTARVAAALIEDPSLIAYLGAVESTETPGHQPV